MNLAGNTCDDDDDDDDDDGCREQLAQCMKELVIDLRSNQALRVANM